MNKDKINSKIEDLEAELQELKLLANAPEQRTPKAGDVYQDHYGPVIILEDSIYRISRGKTQDHGNIEFYESATYLGKFDEVYVKISDIRAAVITYNYQGSTVMSTEALCDLNIITN